jgi:asparagine synthase (glutamine-hydrolysing)
MTIAALYGRDGEPAPCLDGLWLERVVPPGVGGRTLWLGRAGNRTDAQVDPDFVVVSEAHSGPTASAIASAYALHGLGCSAHLEGSFSFVLYDRRRELLLATSDLTSRCPLAYWVDRDTLALSSRALRIVGHPRVGRTLDDLYLANLVTGLLAAPAGTTALRDVKRLTAGAAIVGRGDEIEIVTVDRLAPRFTLSQSKASCIVGLWHELSLAVDCASREGRTYLSLSGGLDSAALASVIASDPKRTAPMPAFSFVGRKDAADELRAIEEIEGSCGRRIMNERIDASHATDLPSLDAYELPDDPVLTPLAYLPARLRLWEAVRRAGGGTLIDGEGGDELFSLVGATDALRQGQWRTAAKYLLGRKSRRALFLRAFLLPLAPAWIRQEWVPRRAKDAELLPTYLSAQARAHPAIAQAAHQFTEMEIGRSRGPVLDQWLSNPYAVGARCAHRWLAAQSGVGLSSPFMSRAVVELVLGIPAQWILTTEYKGFLRDAAVGRVPERVRVREKDIALPTALFRKMLGSPAVRDLIANPVVRERLGDWIRFERLQGMMDAIAVGHDLNDPLLWAQVEGLVTFAYWYRRARREYGIV